MAIPLGINLSFCVKRWVTPALWAPLVREQLDLDLVQLTFDLIDPLWPDDLQVALADDLRRETEAHGVTVHSAFIGLAHYTFNQLLHPNPQVRDVAELWMIRAYRLAARCGIRRVGGPLGAIASRSDADEQRIDEADYADLIARMHRLADAARAEGIEELYVEPTPMRREWPWTVDQARRMSRDTAQTSVPWKFCVDWGHGTLAPLYGKANARMDAWYEGLGPAIGAIHIQQTDGQFDRHWDFTEAGCVDPLAAASLQRSVGLESVPVFLEVFYPFERSDDTVLAALKQSSAILKAAFR